MRVCILSYSACNAHAPCCHLWPAPLYNIFPHFVINGTIFGGGGEFYRTQQNVCFDFLYNFCLKHFWFCEEMSEILLKIVSVLYVRYRLLLSDFNETGISSTIFRKILKISIFLKIRPVVAAGLFHADRRTDSQTWRSEWSLFEISRRCLKNCQLLMYITFVTISNIL